MGFTYVGNSIQDITWNDTLITKSTWNTYTTFFSKSSYVFPNANRKMTGSSTYGITLNVRTQTSGHEAFKALDNNTAAFYAGSTSTNNKNQSEFILITFPFKINLLSVKITNGNSSGYTYSGYHGMTAGNIYVGYGDTNTLFASFSGRNASDGYASTHQNSYISGVPTTMIKITGTAWGNVEWHTIGEITLTFNAKTSDLSNYGL